MRLTSPALHALAAEYVVGTLRGAARRRFEAMARADREVAAIVERWECELTPLAERVAPVEPPARVWKAIERRLTARGAPALDFWQSLGMLASGLATVLAVAFLWLAPARDADPNFVAVLAASDSVPRMVVSMHSASELRVRIVKPWTNLDGKALELWALPKNGAPRSLGLIENDRDTRIRIASVDPRMLGANALAVSLEPRGGSPTGQPTGPVLCSGVIAPYQGPRTAA
jgi:anti-sigma-K factor RskA